MAFALSLSDQDLDRLFPAHLIVGAGGAIKRQGPSLRLHLDGDIAGADILDEFDIARPLRVRSADRLLVHNQTVLMRHRRVRALELQGVVYAHDDLFFFLMSHVPNVDGDAENLKYRFSDFGPFDGSKDLFLASQIRSGLLKDTQELITQLKAEKQAAEAANAAKSEFLACMSHEIRTPLNGVLGISAILERTALDDNQLMMLQSLRSSGFSLLETLNDIIDISKMDAHLLEIDEAPFCLAEVADHVRTTYEISCADKGVALTVEVDPAFETLPLLGDGARIRQILNNLVSNALKFTESGEIAVTATADWLNPGKDLIAEFSVRDTGIGIDAEGCEKIFAPFVQADAGITRKYSGTGLGLSICRRLCDLMSGEIGVQSRPGVGSTFTFRLPLKTTLAAVAAAG